MFKERCMFLESREKAIKIAEILRSKKASDIEVLDIGKITIIADCFVICTGNSTTQVEALANEILEKMNEAGEKELRVEGLRGGGWILIDFGNVIVHIFKRETREFYGLEHLWGDAEKLEFDTE